MGEERKWGSKWGSVNGGRKWGSVNGGRKWGVLVVAGSGEC